MKRLTLIQAALCLIGVSLVSLIPQAYSAIRYDFYLQSFVLAIVCSVPLLAFGYYFLSKKGQHWKAFHDIYLMIRESQFGRAIEFGTPFWFLLISALAGVFEELIFRGVLQNKIGLIPSALLFGLVHFVNWTYFLITFLIGLYLGAVYYLSEVNLLVPSFIHFIYDLVLLFWFQKKILRGDL